MSQEPKPNLEWCRDRLRDFRRYESEVRRVKEDERRYRNQIGYMPASTKENTQ